MGAHLLGPHYCAREEVHHGVRVENMSPHRTTSLQDGPVVATGLNINCSYASSLVKFSTIFSMKELPSSFSLMGCSLQYCPPGECREVMGKRVAADIIQATINLLGGSYHSQSQF